MSSIGERLSLETEDESIDGFPIKAVHELDETVPVSSGIDSVQDTTETLQADETATADVMAMIIRTANSYELLTAAKEVELAKQKDIYLQFRDELFSGKGKDLQPKERNALLEQEINSLTNGNAKEAVIRGKNAFELLINSNLRLVISIAKKYQGYGMSLADLHMEGVPGLYRAAEKFDWRQGNKFSTYGTWWIKQSISRALAEKSRTVRVPGYYSEKMRFIIRTSRELSHRLNREATPGEIAAELGMTTEEVADAIEVSRPPVSLNIPVGEDGESELIDLIGDTKTSDELGEVPIISQRNDVLQEALYKLKGSSQVDDGQRLVEVIARRYGLGCEPQTLEEVGQVLGVTRERIRQLEQVALKELKNYLEANNYPSAIDLLAPSEEYEPKTAYGRSNNKIMGVLDGSEFRLPGIGDGPNALAISMRDGKADTVHEARERLSITSNTYHDYLTQIRKAIELPGASVDKIKEKLLELS